MGNERVSVSRAPIMLSLQQRQRFLHAALRERRECTYGRSTAGPCSIAVMHVSSGVVPGAVPRAMILCPWRRGGGFLAMFVYCFGFIVPDTDSLCGCCTPDVTLWPRFGSCSGLLWCHPAPLLSLALPFYRTTEVDLDEEPHESRFVEPRKWTLTRNRTSHTKRGCSLGPAAQSLGKGRRPAAAPEVSGGHWQRP